MIGTMTNDPPSDDPDRYFSVDDGPEAETKVKGSRFIAQIFRADGAEAARTCLAQVRRRYHDATHHCWAQRIGPPENVLERHEDDGEPAGTAGIPILNALRRGGLLDVIAVVTRYFGGTKLGTGGLCKAYREAAATALGSTPRRMVWLSEPLSIEFSFDDLGAIESTLAKARDAILGIDRTFGPRPRIVVSVKRSRASALQEGLTAATAGRVVVKATRS